MMRWLAWLGLVFAAAAFAQPSPEDLRDQLCERALLVGGSLEEYLAGVGLDDPAAVTRARELLDRLLKAHPGLPESYVKLAVLMAAEDGTTLSDEAAEATLEVLAGCGGEPEEKPLAAPAAEPAAAVELAPAPEPESAVEPASEDAAEEAAEEDVEEPPPPAIGDPRKAFLEGVALADRGAVAEAEAVFRSLIATYPQLPEPYVNLAALLAAGGDEGGASLMAESALLAHPVCRAAFELEMLRDFGEHSRTLLADLGRSADRRTAATRVVGPGWIPSPGAHLEEIRAIADTVSAWLKAWSQRRIDEYLGFYADDFRPAEGDLRRWRAGRRSRFAGSPPTVLEISGLDVDVSTPVAGTASFTLRSRSSGAGVAVTVEKHLELEKVGDAWKIVSERPGE